MEMLPCLLQQTDRSAIGELSQTMVLLDNFSSTGKKSIDKM